jgi:glycosyltransferase involved in cell wall biosynthesis
MRILVDAHVFDEAHQGTRTYIKGIYSELIALHPANIKIFFCATNTANLENEFGKHDHVEYIRLKSSNKFIRLAVEFPALIFRHKIDFAHFQYISPLIKLCREIVTIHDVLFLDFPEFFPLKYRTSKSFLFKRSSKRADLIFTVSEYSKQALNRHFKLPLQKIQLTPNAVSAAFFAQKNLPAIATLKTKYKLRKYLLYVSRIEPRKNQILLLRVFHELGLHTKGYDLVFIGRTDIEAREFTDYLEQLEPEERSHIAVLENIGSEELNLFYSGCELFVYPSLAEGFGIPPLEAAASGCDVLCANTTAMMDFDFFGAALFNPHDPEELKTKILKKLQQTDSDRLLEIQEIVRSKYNWKSVANIFLNAVQQSEHSR